jgi:hypothetical protein
MIFKHLPKNKKPAPILNCIYCGEFIAKGAEFTHTKKCPKSPSDRPLEPNLLNEPDYESIFCGNLEGDKTFELN